MRKAEELATPTSCMNQATPDTNVFVLLDWDRATPGTIRYWCMERVKLGLNKADDPQIMEAYQLATEIEKSMNETRARRRERVAMARLSLNPAAVWPFPEKAA